MKTYCVRCRKKTENLYTNIFKTIKSKIVTITSKNVLTVELKSQYL